MKAPEILEKINQNKGFFITFEGGEGVGKSTQIGLLRDALKQKGLNVLQTREPGGNPEAEYIRNTLLSKNEFDLDPLTEALLIFAARLEHVQKTIRPALANHYIVLCDRFTDSTLAYQGYAGGIDLLLLRKLQNLTLEKLKPDLTFLLDMPIEESLNRMKLRGESEDRFESKGLEFHEKLRNGFLELADKEPKRICKINAQISKEEIAQIILNHTLKLCYF